MATFDFTVGKSDNNVVWSFPVFDAFDLPIDPTGATGVTIHFRIDDDSAAAADLTGAVFAQTAGPAFLGHTFQSAELAVPGVYLAQCFYTLAGVRRTYPSDRKMRVLVESAA